LISPRTPNASGGALRRLLVEHGQQLGWIEALQLKLRNPVKVIG